MKASCLGFGEINTRRPQHIPSQLFKHDPCYGAPGPEFALRAGSIFDPQSASLELPRALPVQDRDFIFCPNTL